MKNLTINKFKLLYDNILIKGITIDKRDGVLTAQSYESKPELGTVVSVGSLPGGVKVKDTVYFNKYSSVKFNVDGEDFFIVRAEDIIGYIRP